VATVLAELGEMLGPERLTEIAEHSPMPWSQRLGYLLDFVEHAPRTERLAAFVATRATETAPLVHGVETVWVQSSQVEQDLVINRALVEIFADDQLTPRLGGEPWKGLEGA
jgi:hypothetical protein